MIEKAYFPESESELFRLEYKTDKAEVIDQARWAGLSPGMSVLDVGCGPGITTHALATVATTKGRIVGLDRSEERTRHAKNTYSDNNITFVCDDFFNNLEYLGTFDFVWMRFITEYFLAEGTDLLRRVCNLVRPGGILFVADLDLNCMNHYGHSDKLDKTFIKITEHQMTNNNFDPFAGRKLPTRFHELGLTNISVDIRAHHLVYGKLTEFNKWNWWQKIEIVGRKSGWTFEDYENGFEGFKEDFIRYFSDERRFAYTPLVMVRGERSK